MKQGQGGHDMFDIYFFEAFEEEEAALRRYLPSGVKAGFTSKTIQESACAEPPAPLISLRTQSLLPPAWAEKMAGLLTRSTGYDHLVRYREEIRQGIPCGYLPLYCARAVAEQALLLWMALLRKLPEQTAHFQSFHRDGITGRECEKKCLAIFGVGHIGYEVSRIGKGLGMEVLGVDILPHHPDISYVQPSEALRRADVIVCAMNLTAENRGYFHYETWKNCRPGAVFVNIARGELAPTEDLLRALEEPFLSGAGLDVFDEESELAVSLRTGRPSNRPGVQAVLRLARNPRVILTPHNAFNTLESVERKSQQSMEQVAHFQAHGRWLWPVPG